MSDADEEVVVAHNWDELRRLMWNYVGIVRTDKRLERAKHRLSLLRDEIQEYYANFRVTRDLLELRNLVDVATLIVKSAHSRRESRGLHHSRDWPNSLPKALPSVLTRARVAERHALSGCGRTGKAVAFARQRLLSDRTRSVSRRSASNSPSRARPSSARRSRYGRPRFRKRTHRIEIDAAGHFEHGLAVRHTHRFTHHVEREVVEQHRLRAMCECRIELCKRLHFDLHRHARLQRKCASSASPTPPPPRWVFLDQMPSYSASRWFSPPPTRTAYFCASRRPGSVLRVSRIFARVPSTRST